MQQFIMIGLIILIMYLFMFRPQMKKMKVEREFKDKLQKNDKVVTIGGIHGRIVEIADKTFLIEVDNNVKLRIEKTSVSAEASKQYQTEVKK
ncbi:MAG TPA: preprotein translocase subunit YajC [Bacteroidia bacterium]|nr:preprotein translocase subunit YajC [Bacteroidia bacterium]HNU33880.1 preprotein translocase subunit YajC [Bacteroidia bacterium]